MVEESKKTRSRISTAAVDAVYDYWKDSGFPYYPTDYNWRKGEFAKMMRFDRSTLFKPKDKIVGLSKLARTLDLYANRLQNQERITSQIAERLVKELNPLGVAVTLKAQHLCMNMRGVKKHNTWTTTSKMLGVFKDDNKARNEFFNIINGTK